MACSIEFLTEKMEEVKIADDIFLGNDLSYEENFLNRDIEKFIYLHRKNMSICCEALTMTETIARKLFKIADRLIDEHFFQTNGLRQLGWCARYMLDRPSVNYYTKIKKNFCEKLK